MSWMDNVSSMGNRMNISEFFTAALKAYPLAQITEDHDGQLIINTGLIEIQGEVEELEGLPQGERELANNRDNKQRNNWLERNQSCEGIRAHPEDEEYKRKLKEYKQQQTILDELESDWVGDKEKERKKVNKCET